MKSLSIILLYGIIVAFFILLGPWCFIWAINTLVQAGGATSFVIPFNFWTWLASLILNGTTILNLRGRK